MGNATYYTYDALNRQISMTNALGQTEQYTYDANSNLSSTTDPDGNSIYYSYDKLNRQTQVLYPDDSFHYYEYNAASELIEARDERGWTYYSYNKLSQIIKESAPDGAETNYSYDEAGRRTMVVAGQAWRYDYDEAGRMVTIEERAFPNEGYGLQAYGTTGYGGTQSEGPNLPGSVYYEYDATNKLTKKTLGNGCYTYFAYDRANRLSQMLSYKPDSTPLAYFEYTYDAASRITQCQREDGTMIYYEYDQASRLTREVCQGAAEMAPTYDLQWYYDTAGNRTCHNWDGFDTYYIYDAGNALIMDYSLAYGYTYYSYDSKGNCTLIQDSEESIYFEYNHANLVTSIHYISQMGNDPVWNYFYYDSQLRRYAMQDHNGLAYFTWDSNGLNLLEEKNSQGNRTVQYTHGYTPIEGIGSLVATKKEVDGCTYYQYPIYDHRGTIVKLVDENAQTIENYHYNAWGYPFSYAVDRFGWQSNWIQLQISCGGLFLSPTRIYSPKAGRFLQRDPKFSFNLYEAFNSNAITFSDSNGLEVPQSLSKNIASIIKIIEEKLTEKIKLLKETKWGKTVRGRLLLDEMEKRLASVVWIIELYDSGKYRYVKVKNGLLHDSEALDPENALWDDDNKEMSIGLDFTGIKFGIEGKEKILLDINKYVYINIDETLRALAHECVHSLNSIMQRTKVGGWWKFGGTLKTSTQEEKDAQKAGKEVINEKNEYYEKYQDSPEKNDYIEIGEEWFKKYEEWLKKYREKEWIEKYKKNCE